jgi:hypothetical protein
MGNKGWDSTQGGSTWVSNARTTGRVSGTDGFDALMRGDDCADPGMHNDPLDQRSDYFGPPGQLNGA